MNGNRNVIWAQGRLADAAVRPWRPAALAAAVAGLVLLIDLALAFGLRTGERQDDLYFENDFQARHYLEHVAENSKNAWLLIGDSVLAGDSIREEVPDWNHRRVIDYMRTAAAPHAPQQFYQIALNGLLPVDMLRILRELDRRDPRGRAGVVLEINRRFFSRAYAGQDACTRPWLENLAPPLIKEGRLDTMTWIQSQAQVLSGELRALLPIFRHRVAFDNPLNAWLAQVVLGASREKAEDPAAVQARMREHFREVSFDNAHSQMRAFLEILSRLRGAGRAAVLFTPPLNDAEMNGLVSERQYGDDLAALARAVARQNAPNIQLVPMDHSLFQTVMFKDIAHMFPEGNRLLAINLLQAMNVPLAELPRFTETIYPEGPNATLVWNIPRGANNGAAWQAAFNQPDGIDVDATQRVVIADTGNHCLREYLPGARTVATLAGKPGDPGAEDGPAGAARLHAPQHPCVLGDDVFFADDHGRRLRRVRHGAVFTEYPLDGPAWQHVRLLRARGSTLYVLDAGYRILAYDPRNKTSRPVVECPGGQYRIQSFDLAPDGRIFLADAQNRIWWGALAAPLRLPETMRMLFANTARESTPMQIMPFSFHRIRLEQIADMRYIPRYNGLLIQDVFAPNTPVKGLDERVHLRFFCLADHMVYPWLKTQVSGAYTVWNAPAETYVSPVHLGSMAIEQSTGTWYQLEQNRSRLLRLGDGLWETAKISQMGAPFSSEIYPNLLATTIANYLFENRQPQRFLTSRVETLPRTGPYIGLLIGASNVSSTDLVPSYSLGRAMELRLQRRLGLCDGVRLDVMIRSEGGINFREFVETFETFAALEGRADLLIIALRDALAEESENDFIQLLHRLSQAAQRYDTRMLFFDSTGLQGMRSEGLRMRPPTVTRAIELMRQGGFHVIEPSETLLRESLEIVPFGCPPYTSHHAAPWAVEYAADVISDALYPHIREHLAGRIPALLQSYPEEEPPAGALRNVFDEFNVDWEMTPWAPVDLAACQRKYEGPHLDIFVDLNKLPQTLQDTHPAPLDAIALAVLYNTLYRDLAGRLATSVSVSLVRFSNYDEYGAGVRQSADLLYRRALDADALRAYLDEHFPGKRTEQPSSPEADDNQ